MVITIIQVDSGIQSEIESVASELIKVDDSKCVLPEQYHVPVRETCAESKGIQVDISPLRAAEIQHIQNDQCSVNKQDSFGTYEESSLPDGGKNDSAGKFC